jgi:hypothetical protein
MYNENNMNNKLSLSLNIAFTVVAIGLVVAIGFYVFSKKPAAQTPVAQNANTNVPPANVPPVNQPETSIVYTNSQYGFNFTLPTSWKGYTIVNTTWDGTAPSNKGQKTIATGPLISIRHPLWTTAVPRQDIPIMVFTLGQWDAMQKDQFHIGAAPINPSELDRNTKYVFALPARYNYAFPVGFEEVDTIIQNKPLSAF